MASRFQALNSLDFTGSNQLRQAAANQIKQGLAQGQQAFGQFNTNLTNRATQQGLNQIRNLDSRAAVEASPLSSITPQYADQSKLQSAYDANKVKQQGLYEDDQMQQGLAAIHGIKSLDDYGKATANQFLSKFGQHVTAANKAKLGLAFENQDDVIKKQMTADTQWDQQQLAVSEKPLVDKIGVDIQGSTLDNIEQIKTGIKNSDLSDATKTSLLNQAEKKAVNSSVLDNAIRTKQGQTAQDNINKFVMSNDAANNKAVNTLKTSAAKVGLPLNANGTLDTTNMTPDDITVAQDRMQPLVDAFKKSTKSTAEFNDFLDSMSGVSGVTPTMLSTAKAGYKAAQANRAKLDPLLQTQYDEDMGIYNAGVQSKIDTINMQKANSIKLFQDVSATTQADMGMTKGDAAQSATKSLQAQGLDLDSNDMEDLMGFLTKNTNTEDPYILAEVAKTLPISLGFAFGDADYGWSNDANVIKAAKEAVVAAKQKQVRAQEYLNQKDEWDKQIIDLNTSKLQKSRDLTAKLRLKNLKTTQKLFK